MTIGQRLASTEGQNVDPLLRRFKTLSENSQAPYSGGESRVSSGNSVSSGSMSQKSPW